MLAALKNTLAQLNVETRQGAAAVARVTPAPAPAASDAAQNKTPPSRVDAVTSATQPIASYFAAQMPPPRPKDHTSD